MLTFILKAVCVFYYVRLYIVDPEDDVIQFSSDEELLEALGFVEGSVFKVFVRGK